MAGATTGSLTMWPQRRSRGGTSGSWSRKLPRPSQLAANGVAAETRIPCRVLAFLGRWWEWVPGRKFPVLQIR
jgi:hypothetical protein